MIMAGSLEKGGVHHYGLDVDLDSIDLPLIQF
jgi:hypothetical protein